jgi:hypothetical protein
MTNHKKPKRIKQKFYTTKGKEPLKAVSSDLLIQQSETSKSIKNYNTSGINYDKRIYNKLVRNMEAQKVASQSSDADLKIKLKNYGDNLRNDLKKSVGQKKVTIPQNVQATPIYRPQSHQLNDNYMQTARDQQHQVESLSGNGVMALAEQIPYVETQVINVEEQQIQIMNKLKSKKYDTKPPKPSTIASWARIYKITPAQVREVVTKDSLEKMKLQTEINEVTNKLTKSQKKNQRKKSSVKRKKK